MLDALRTRLLALVGAGWERLSTPDLWDRYLISIGRTTGTVLERQALEAVAKNTTLAAYQNGDIEEVYGPELVTLPYASWAFSGTGPPTGDANGIHYSGSNSLAAATHAAITFDNALYEVTYEVFNYTAGGVRMVVGGETTNHGWVGTTRTANGVYTERGRTEATSTVQDQFRFQSTATPTTVSVRNISVKRIT